MHKPTTHKENRSWLERCLRLHGLSLSDCLVNINPNHIKFHIPALHPNDTQLRPMHFLHQTARTNLWFNIDLYRCSIVDSSCIYAHAHAKRDEGGGRYSGWECITDLEELKKCFEFVESTQSGHQGLRFKVRNRLFQNLYQICIVVLLFFSKC